MSTIVGFFDDRSQAERAMNELVGIGIMKSQVQLLSGDLDSQATKTKRTTSGDLTFGEKVKRFFTGVGDWDDDSSFDYYAEGVRRGGATLAVTAEEPDLDRICDVLNDNGAVDIDRRAQFYKESGFSKYDFGAVPYSGDESLKSRNQFMDWEKNRLPDLDSSKEEVIPVVEERVNIGKRAIDKGRVRIYTRVTETPVDKELNLREEHIEVDRVPVDRPIGAKDMDAFREGEIELRETAEEAVVEKEARVVEEVRVRKQAEERTETVHETAKRTDVEVDRSGVDHLAQKDRLTDSEIINRNFDNDRINR